jgi:hypothetical protein
MKEERDVSLLNGPYARTSGSMRTALAEVAVGRLLVVVDGQVGVGSADLAAAWDSDTEARALGLAAVEASTPGAFLPDVMSLVVIPLVVNVASTAITAMVGRLMARLRQDRAGELRVEISGEPDGIGDVIVVVRLPGERKSP